MVMDPNPPPKMTLWVMIREIMRGGEWWTPFELREALLERYQRKVSDSTITARLRDFDKEEFRHLGYRKESRRRKGSEAFEYRLVWREARLGQGPNREPDRRDRPAVKDGHLF